MPAKGVASSVLAAATVVALMAIVPAHARANGGGLLIGDDAVGATVLGTSAAVFGTTDVIFIALGRPMPPWLALLQIGLGGLLIPYVAGSTSPWTEVQVGAYVSAIWFTAHGIYDLARYPEYRKQKVRERELERERARERTYGLSVAPRAHGGVTVELQLRL